MKTNPPVRTCVACRREFEKNDLIRIVRTPEGDVVIDVRGKANGRGAYFCKDPKCFDKLKKAKLIERALGVPISEEVYASIREAVIANQE